MATEVERKGSCQGHIDTQLEKSEKKIASANFVSSATRGPYIGPGQDPGPGSWQSLQHTNAFLNVYCVKKMLSKCCKDPGPGSWKIPYVGAPTDPP
jgi:hypothetical protein